jgi:ferritin-like metal-binding protein YciE
MKINSFEELLVHELRELYDAEQHITKALPKMIKAASSQELRAAFQDHLDVTKMHVSRLEEALGALAQPIKGETCKGLKGLVDEGEQIIDEKADPAVKDAGLIVAAQKIEHYEIASYGSVRTWAQILGHERIADLFERTLQEEKEADKKLTALAESAINVRAREQAPV